MATPTLDPLLSLLQKALSHELPNQSIALTGLARLVELEAGERLGAAREYLERLAAAGQRSHQFVRELAELVRLARQPPPAEPVALAEAVRAAVEELRQAISDLQVQLSFAEDALTADLPAAVLRFAVLQALKLGGRTLRSARQSDRVRIEIVVPGPLPAKLFEPFAGPNLAAAAAVLACHGGAIEVESTGSDHRIGLVLPGPRPVGPGEVA